MMRPSIADHAPQATRLYEFGCFPCHQFRCTDVQSDTPRAFANNNHQVVERGTPALGQRVEIFIDVLEVWHLGRNEVRCNRSQPIRQQESTELGAESIVYLGVEPTEILRESRPEIWKPTRFGR